MCIRLHTEFRLSSTILMSSTDDNFTPTPSPQNELLKCPLRLGLKNTSHISVSNNDNPEMETLKIPESITLHE